MNNKHSINVFLLIISLFGVGMGYCNLDAHQWKDYDFFAENDGYSKLVKEGVAMHPHAVEQILPILTEWLASKQKSVSILDIACGTQTPVVPYFIADHLAKYNIHINYTGVDINQSLQNTCFHFPENVVNQTLLVGNAYQMDFFKEKQDKFSMIYSGLNIHHLNPREFVKISRDYKNLLETDGILILFDLFRPTEFAYIPKPEHMQMIDPTNFGNTPEINLPNNPNDRQDWKEAFTKIYTEYARSKNIDEQTIDQVKAHILENDYPMTMDEVATLLKENGYCIEKILPFHQMYPEIPISPFFGIIVAHPSKKQNINIDVQ